MKGGARFLSGLGCGHRIPACGVAAWASYLRVRLGPLYLYMYPFLCPYLHRYLFLYLYVLLSLYVPLYYYIHF